MEFGKYTEFENFALAPICRLLDSTFDNSYFGYNSELTSRHRNVLRERRDEKEKYASDLNRLDLYINDFYIKVRGLKTSLFHETSGEVTYLLESIRIDDSGSAAMLCIRILKDLVYQLYETAKRDYDSIFISAASSVTPAHKSKPKRSRSPNRDSFFLYNQNVNFNAIHARLTQEGHYFIDPQVTSVADIRAVFSGQNISEQVVWRDANSLRYFIRELFKRKLIESPNEGIWKRTVACFKPSEGVFKPNDFKDTKDPIASVTLLLDEVLRLFSA
jgi:hypothetical protein